MVLSRFVKLWTRPDHPLDPVSEVELGEAERHLHLRLPPDYRSAILQLGLPRPKIELLDAIVDRELDLRCVSDFLTPAEMVSVTEDWRDLGMSEELVAFATDYMGSLFCFAVGSDADGMAPVFFFDHDERTVEVIAPSFTQWLDGFCAIAPH